MTAFGRLIVLALSFVLTASVCQAANLVGFLIYAPPTGSENTQAKVVAFSDIYWQSPEGGSITTLSGSTDTFTDASIAQFVYLDEAYWRSMNDNASYGPFRPGVLDREVIIPGEHSDITSDNEIHFFTIGSQTLDFIMKAAPDYAAALTPLKTKLDADVTRYQSGERKVNGQWISLQDYQSTYGRPSAPVSTEDWTTEDGKTYKNVVVNSQEDDGVNITYAGGAAKIPYYMLPLKLQKRFGQDFDSLEAKRKAAEKALAEATRKAAERKKQQEEAVAASAQPQMEQEEGNAGQTPPRPVAATQPNPPPANPTAPPAQVENKGTPPGSVYSYNESKDVCYLDSPAVEVTPESPIPAATAPNLPVRQTLFLRITTEGNRPEAPKKIEAFFLSTDTAKKPDANGNVTFLVDGTSVPLGKIENPNGDLSFVGGHLANRVAFQLSQRQAQLIFRGQYVTFSIGEDAYGIDPNGMAVFKKYFAEVDRLRPTSPLIRAYHNFFARLPSLTDLLGTVCEYVIYGVVILALVAVLTAFALCATSFMKM